MNARLSFDFHWWVKRQTKPEDTWKTGYNLHLDMLEHGIHFGFLLLLHLHRWQHYHQCQQKSRLWIHIYGTDHTGTACMIVGPTNSLPSTGAAGMSIPTKCLISNWISWAVSARLALCVLIYDSNMPSQTIHRPLFNNNRHGCATPKPMRYTNTTGHQATLATPLKFIDGQTCRSINMSALSYWCHYIDAAHTHTHTPMATATAKHTVLEKRSIRTIFICSSARTYRGNSWGYIVIYGRSPIWLFSLWCVCCRLVFQRN